MTGPTEVDKDKYQSSQDKFYGMNFEEKSKISQ